MTKHIHLVGIGGTGLSAIATVLLQQHNTISGSDMHESENTARLRALGATVHIGHRAENITAPDAVVVSSAIPADNPEIAAARAKGIPVFKRPAWLGQMMTGTRGIAIAGAHGKTTTTAMVALVMSRANLSPTFIVGSFIPQLKTNAAAGNSDWFIIEADEYDHTFLSLKPELAIITNIERDHPDTYPTDESLYRAFVQFAELIPPHGALLACGDDAGVQHILPQLPTAETYGTGENNRWRAVNIAANKFGGFTFEPLRDGVPVAPKIALRVPGIHNVKNALAALAVCIKAGIAPKTAAEILATFTGTARRFELKGEAGGITVIDDYAHNPTELRATLAAARARFGKRHIWAVFQPHTFSRTKLLRHKFSAAFGDADHVILLDIYPAREKDDGSISSADILTEMRHPDARYLPGTLSNAADFLLTHLSSGDILITLGAGDGYRVGEMVLEKLSPVETN